jgi:hypothetical protein
VTLSFRANHAMGGHNPFVYDLTNFVIHSGVALMA